MDTSWNGSAEQEAESLGLLEAVLHENEQEGATEYFDEAGWAVNDSGNECDTLKRPVTTPTRTKRIPGQGSQNPRSANQSQH